MNDKVQLLSSLYLFRDLTMQELAALDYVTTVRRVRKGRVFYRPEERGESLFMLRKGLVQVYRISPEGKKLIITRLNGGSLFGEMALMGNQVHNTFAEASDDCTVVVMNRQDLERLVLQKPEVGLRLVEIAGHRLRETERRLEDLAFKSVGARIASLLLQLDPEDTGEVAGITHLEISETVGTYRETASQILSALKGSGLIKTGRRHIKILDRQGLEYVAHHVGAQV